MSGLPPFNGHNESQIFEAIKKGTFNFNAPVWKNISLEAKDFVSYMLEFDKLKRPTADQCLQHPWIIKNSLTEIDENQCVEALN